MIEGDDDEPSTITLLDILFLSQTLQLTSVCMPCSSPPSTDAWMVIPATSGNHWTLGEIQTMLELFTIQPGDSWPMSACQLTFIVIQTFSGKVCVGFDPQERSEDSLVMSTRTSILIAPILALIGKL